MGPDFIVIGSMKAATSTVCAYLEDHPEIFMLPQAEPNYFSDEANWQKGEGWYRGLFAAAGEGKLIGEGSNDYCNASMYPDAAARIAQFNPSMKLIFMVRDPIERIRSDYIQRRADSGDVVPSTIDAAVRDDPDWFIGQSRYWKNISSFRDQFDDGQLFVGFMEELKKPEAFFKRLTDFLGVSDYNQDMVHRNPSKGKVVPSGIYSKLRQTPVVYGVSKLVPRSVRRRLIDSFLSVPEKDVIVSRELRNYILDNLGDDIDKFLEFYGKPSDFWKSVVREGVA